MSLNEAQEQLYRSLAARFTRFCVDRLEMSAAEAKAERDRIRIDALDGADRRYQEFDNADLTRVKAALLAYMGDADLTPQLKADDPTRDARLYWIRERAGLHPSYVRELSRDKFGTTDWERLGDQEFQQLFITLKQRTRAMSKRAAMSS